MTDSRSDDYRVLRGVAVALLVVGCALFVWRGPWRAVVDHGARWDGGLVYSLSRAWMIGENPYEAAGVGKGWLDGGGPPESSPSLRGAGILLYPPTTLAAMAPLAALPWPAFEWIWTLLNVAMYAAAMWSVARLARLHGVWLIVFFAIGVWLSPAMTNIKAGQTALVPLGCIALAAWLVSDEGKRICRGGSGIVAGGLLAFATAIKPQLALPFIVYEAGRMRWRVAVAAAVLLVLIGGIGAWRLQSSGTTWYASWQRNMEGFQLREDGNPRRENTEHRHQMINLHYPLHSFTDDRRLVNGLVLSLIAIPCLVYLVIDLRDQKRRGRLFKEGSVEGEGELLSLSMTTAATLLVAYHRFYDAAALIFPVGLAVAGLARRERRHWITLALCAPFLVPGSIILKQLKDSGRLPAFIGESWAWDRLILPHEAWAVFLLLWWLVWLRWERSRAIPQPS